MAAARLFRALLAAALLGAGAAACARSEPAAPTTAFSGLVEDAARDLLAGEPERAAALGIGAAGPWRLNDRSSIAGEIERTAALRRLAQARGVTAQTLPRADRLVHAALMHHFTVAAAGAEFPFGRFSPLSGFSPYVLNPVDAAFVTLPALFEAMPAPGGADLRAFGARLQAVAPALDAETARARADAAAGIVAPLSVLDAAAARLSQFIDTPPADWPYLEPLRARIAATAPGSGDHAQARAAFAEAEAAAAASILPAYRRAALAVAEMRARAGAEPGVWRLKDGPAYYAAALAYATQPGETADSLHKAGLRRIRQVSDEMDMMLRAQGLTQGGVGERMAALNPEPRPPAPDAPKAAAENAPDTAPQTTPKPAPENAPEPLPDPAPNAALERFTALVRQQEARSPKWLQSPGGKLAIRTSGFGAALRYTPAPLDGSGPGVLWADPERLGRLPRHDFLPLANAFAFPGRHVQAEKNRTHAGPLVLRLLAAPAFTEGWALYALTLGEEMGVYEGDPSGRLGALHAHLRAAARLVADTGVHAKRWTREEARAFLSGATGDGPAAIDAELDAIAAAPGRACSGEFGRAEIMRLRDAARARLGTRFTIGAFHAVLLGAGAPPPAVLEGLIGEWARSGRPPAPAARPEGS